MQMLGLGGHVGYQLMEHFSEMSLLRIAVSTGGGG